MAGERAASWQSIRDTIMLRIRDRTYPPGELIPNEADIAAEFGCARATVNRALRDLAEEGFLDRRRKAGTRVIEAPQRKATLEIPQIRREVEARGQVYGYRLLARATGPAPEEVRARLKLPEAEATLYLESLHLADGEAHMFEQRWVVLRTVPGIASADLAAVSPNEWLVREAPYTHGGIACHAEPAGQAAAAALGCAPADPVLVMERQTWLHEAPITYVREHFAQSYRLCLGL
ncbi:GntR family transcriptional regulator [Rhodovulum visakhapatnamense]|uniref:GntR family transcriptional regulator n=1 Tax=Rhodovulum visakhapatnamense TaxID=364297 RepID=A0A4R8FLB4_9RHOB|nr:GntR family transcriptional regulator [Rhodovulum visakhapatnamense]TDX27029.1 GntR family transcriptional regulator [Rhodovulum visakhapatnamense]